MDGAYLKVSIIKFLFVGLCVCRWVCLCVGLSVCLDFTKLLLSLLFLLHLSYCSPLEFICKIFCVMTSIFLT